MLLYCSNYRSIIDLELRNKGIHMDIVESEKLKWMEDVPSIMKPFPDSLYNARFDFEGIISFLS